MDHNKREPLLAFIFGILMTGLGQIYVGQARKFLLLLALQLLILSIFSITGLNSTIHGFWLMLLLAGGVHLYSAVSASITAHKYKKYTLKKYNRTLIYLASWFAMACLTILVISARGSILGYETYKIVSRSMAPTLDGGDYILVNAHDKSLSVGKVIAYRRNGTSFVHRVAAIENDRLSIIDGNIILNDKNIGYLSAIKSRVTKEYSLTMAPTTVARGNFFVLGDNRDNSNDSRFVGQIPSVDVIGTVTGIWFSEDITRAGLEIE